MMKISLVVPNTRYDSNFLWSVLPSRGLLSLAAVLQQNGYSVNYIDADIDNLSHPEIIKQLDSYRSDVVGITMNTFQTKAAVDLARAIKQHKQDVKIVVGGPHPSALRKKLLLDCAWIDIACLGESEKTIAELAKVIHKKESLNSVTGICYRLGDIVYENESCPLIQDIDSIPFPAYDLAGDLNRYPGVEPIQHSPSMHVMASRGCPFDCTFCSRSVWGNKVRFRSPKNTIDEVELLHQRFNINEIYFQDDTMNLNKKWLFSVCDEIIRRELNRRMSFKVAFRVNRKLLDEELLVKAKAAGVWMIFYGVESGNQKVLDIIKKGTTVEEIKRAFELTNKAGIKTFASFMVGNPGDTLRTISDSVALAKTIKPSAFGFSIATPLPGTEFYEIAEKNGWIRSQDFSCYSQNKAISRNEALTMEDITNLRDSASKKVSIYLDRIKEKDTRSVPFRTIKRAKNIAGIVLLPLVKNNRLIMEINTKINNYFYKSGKTASKS